MASTNQSPFYQRAEEDFLKAATDEERIQCLDIMIKECPKHKGAENMLANLKTRMKKLKANVSKQKKSGKSGQEGIKKDEAQCILTGFPNVGKTTIFNILTGLKEKTSPHPFTTFKSAPGVFKYEDTKIQIIDTPPFPNQDKSLLHSTDTILLVVDNLEQIEKADKHLWKLQGKKILIFNKTDDLNEKELRKLEATLKSKYKKWEFFLLSKESDKIQIEKLKEKIFKTFPIIRIYTKEPKKPATKDPMILKNSATAEDAAEKILKGLSKRIKRARVWGPSSKFPGQKIGLEHKLKDKDIIEFQTE